MNTIPMFPDVPTVEPPPQKASCKFYIYYLDKDGNEVCYWRNESTVNYTHYAFSRRGIKRRKIKLFNTYGYAKAQVRRMQHIDPNRQLLVGAWEDK